ncbi:uncharacterized protein C4orf17 homolog [Apteryx mantelli]|uniref:Uncharacterized protein C4orf17 homolog n=1 Tax=Apteryx mantelli TaxID=2696672 RepID=A0A8B7JAJ8_9AVES
MNINFKSRPEPQFNHNMLQNNLRYPPSRSSDGTYFLSRHVPHPRMVCHIRGINNAPICVVRDTGRFLREHISAGKTEVLEHKADQQHVLTGNTTSNASANNYLPRLEACMRKGLGSSRSRTQHGEGGLGDIPKGIPNTPTSLKKLLKKRFQTSTPPATSQEIHAASLTQPSSPFINLHHDPHIQEDTNYVPSYLDQGIKVLEKLCKILRTDSLAEIQGWLSRASIKEKNFVSNLIHSELTGKDLLNYQPRAMNENTAENMNIQSPKKPHPPLWGDAEEEMNQSRPSTTESEASQSKKREREKECLLFSRLRNRSSAHADPLSPGRPCSQQSTTETRTAPAFTLHQKSRLRSSKPPPTRMHPLSREGPSVHSH